MSGASTNRSAECKLCECSEIDRSLKAVDGVCGQCGYMLDSDITIREIDRETVTSAGEQQDVEWENTHRVRNGTEKQIAKSFERLETLCDNIELGPDIRIQAAKLYAEAYKARVTEGRNVGAVISACVRLVCHETGFSIPETTVTNATNVDPNQHRICYAVVQQELEREVSPPSPSDYLPYLTRELDLDPDTAKRIERILDEYSASYSVSGKDPSGIIAGALYISVEAYTQSDVADLVGVSSETIRLRSNEYQEVLRDA